MSSHSDLIRKECGGFLSKAHDWSSTRQQILIIVLLIHAELLMNSDETLLSRHEMKISEADGFRRDWETDSECHA